MAQNKISMIAPSTSLKLASDLIIKETGDEVDTYHTTFDNIPTLVKKLEQNGTEIIISRRGTLANISLITDIPLVGIKTLVSDYIEAFSIAKNCNGVIAIFIYGDEIASEIKPLCNMLNIDFKIYSFTNESNCRIQVQKAINERVVLGLGGGVSEVFANEFGLEYVLLESSSESIKLAIENAKQLLDITIKERKKQELLSIQIEQLENAFKYTHDAIIAIDEDGKIDVLNEKAKNYLPIKKDSYKGVFITEVLPTTRMTHTLKDGRIRLNELMKIGNTLVSTNRLPIIVNNKIKGAVATFQDIKEIQDNEVEIRVRLHEKGLFSKYIFDDIIGKSELMQHVKKLAESYAKSNSTILINGQSGTGKELFAHSIHHASTRRNAPFVAINCASISPTLLEAELFGYEEGAFTGAVKGGKPGVFELAHRGTIFLDEIGDISSETQISLLRVIQEKEVRRIGSDKVTPIDIRIITATNKDLIREVNQGNFREDLYYRLNVLKIDIPPLNERQNDYIEIGMSILMDIAGPKANLYKDRVLQVLLECQNYTWPGNIRELHNFVERIYIQIEHQAPEAVISQTIKELLNKGHHKPLDKENIEQEDDGNPLANWERDRIIAIMKKNNLNITKSALELNISRTTLYRKLAKYQINLEQ